MNAIRIRRKLDSETLYLPELKSLVGQNVEIIVLEELAGPPVTPGTGDWNAAMNAVTVDDYDFDAAERQREYDLRHAKDHLP